MATKADTSWFVRGVFAAIAIFVLQNVALFAAPAVQERWSVPFVPPQVPQADLAQFVPDDTNLRPMPTDTVYQGQVYQYLSAKPEEHPSVRFAAYQLKPVKSGRYALFAAVNVQNQNWSSPVKFRMNQGEWQNIREPVAGTPRWGVSYSLAWACLGVFDLNADTPARFELSSDKPRSLDGRMAMYVNGIIGFRLDEPRIAIIQNVRVNYDRIKAGESLRVSLNSPDPAALNGLVVELRYRDSLVSQGFVQSAPGGAPEIMQAALDVPFDAPGGDYRVAIRPLFYQRVEGAKELALQVESLRPAPEVISESTAKIEKITLKNTDQLHVRLSGMQNTDALIGVWYVDVRGNLMAAGDFPVAKGERETLITLRGERWRQRGAGSIEVFVHGTSAAPISMASTDMGAPVTVKPMSSGVYEDQQSVRHHWYVTDDHALIWDGRPWIPFGGMYCDPVLSFFKDDAKARVAKWEERSRSLDAVTRAGIHDLYINLSHGPLWARQACINDMTRRGIYFGWQLNDMHVPFDAYPIRASLKQGLCMGEASETGKLAVELPREDITGMLLVNVENPQKVRAIDARLDFKQQSSFDFIVMDLKTDQKKGFVHVVLNVPELPTGRYYVLPRISHSGHMLNVWDEQQVLAAHEWIRQIQWGTNLRFLIDPTGNEGGIYNGDESLRVWSDIFQTEYEQWLAGRYGNIQKLETAWALPAGTVADFKDAARLLPLRDRNVMTDYMLWIDPISLKTIRTTGGLGAGWHDYTDAVRVTYAHHRDSISRKIRQWVNVPVVFKRVTPWVCDENINREPGGMNGIGIDIYSDKGSKITTGLSSGATEAALGAQTIWIIGAELGYNANPGNGNVRGFPSAEYVRELTRTTAAWGMKGFMYFGLRLEPYSVWGAMQLYSVPEQLEWINAARADVMSRWPSPVNVAQCYPLGENWWWRSGGELLNRYSCVYDSGPGEFRQTLILNSNGDESQAFSAVNASQEMRDAKILLVNFRDAQSVRIFGDYVRKWMDDGRAVAYIGKWPEGAELKGISEEFLADGKSLKDKPGDEILARESGLITAKRKGNLLLVTGNIRFPGPNSKEPFTALKTEWIKKVSAGM